MALPSPAPDRLLKHRRCIDLAVYARSDGLWEVDARLSDVKTREVLLAGAPRPAGEPVHDMTLRLVVDRRFDVVAAGAVTNAMPYPGHCDSYDRSGADAYGALAGLNLMRGFRAGLRERLGGVLGCTHLNELAQTVPTAVVQAFAGEMFDTRAGSGDQPPFQIDRCHALRSDGDAVRVHYPRWHRQVPGMPVAENADAADSPVG
jgi:hypothetical protein